MQVTSMAATNTIIANATGTVDAGLVIDPQNAPNTGLTAGTSWRIKLADFGSDSYGTYAIGVDPYSMFLGVGSSSTIDFYSDVKPYSAHTATHQMQIGTNGETIYTTMMFASGSGGIDLGGSNDKIKLFNSGGVQSYLQVTGSGLALNTPAGYPTMNLGTVSGADGVTVTTTGTMNLLTGNWSTAGAISAKGLANTGTLSNAGPINPAISTTTLGGSSGGSVTWSEAFQGSAFKEVVASMSSGFAGTATLVLPAAFSATPVVVNSDAAATSVGTGTIVLTGTGTLPRTAVIAGY